MKKEVSFVLTSCGRPKLLNKTLKSFFKYNNYEIKRFFWLKILLIKLFTMKLKKNGVKKLKSFVTKKKKGQIRSIVDTYKKVRTPFVFHCEDDWIYTRKDFIQDSLEILDSDKISFKFGLKAKKVQVVWIYLIMDQFSTQNQKKLLTEE